MQIADEFYKVCPKCGAEASGFETINYRFGYRIEQDVLTPYTECKVCRADKKEDSQSDAEAGVDMQWETAEYWCRQVNISKAVFESYLIDMGYLEYGFSINDGEDKLVITKVGKKHSVVTRSLLGKKILWDYETFVNMAKMRTESAIVHEVCPKCKAYLDTMPDYNFEDYAHTCKRCGRVCRYWDARVIYDR